MSESPRERINRAKRAEANRAQDYAERQGRRAGQDYEKFMGRMALLRSSSIPRYEIEILREVTGLARWSNSTERFTYAEYTTGEENTFTRRKQEQFYAVGTKSGWYLKNINPEQPYDPDNRAPAPSRSFIIADDATVWRNGWEAYGADNVIGVLAGSDENVYPVSALGRFMRQHGLDVPE